MLVDVLRQKLVCLRLSNKVNILTLLHPIDIKCPPTSSEGHCAGRDVSMKNNVMNLRWFTVFSVFFAKNCETSGSGRKFIFVGWPKTLVYHW